MSIQNEGQGELLGWHDPDENRKWIRQNKSRDLRNKRTTLKDAVHKYVQDGNFLVSGGFGHVRVSMAVIYEIVRQKKRDLAVAGNPGCHDTDILIGSGCVNKVEAAYCFAHELRGLSPASRRAVETGKCKVIAEISNAAYQWRFLAAMMGVPFVPSRILLGTDTFKHSSCKVIQDPYSGKQVCLIPACYPDVALIHVNRSDIYGNAQIDGILVDDFELSRAARRLIITTEEIVDVEVIRKEPWRTSIPFYLVDAVVLAPFGAHPCQMPFSYFSDEDHIGEWFTLSKTPEGTDLYFTKYVYGVNTFEEYLEKIGGAKKLEYLQRVELLQTPMKAPWVKQRRKKT